EDGAPVILTLKVYFDLIPATPVEPAAAAYRTEYYFEQTPNGDDYVINDKLTAMNFGKLGATVEAEILEVEDYILNSAWEESVLSGEVVMPTAGEDGAPVILTLKVYYEIPTADPKPLDPIKAAYITEYYFETEDGVYEINEDETERDFASVGDIVDAEIKEFEGYVHNAEWEESILSGEVVMPSAGEDGTLQILTLKVYYDIAESVAHGGFKVVKGDGEYEVSETFMFELYGVVDGAKTEVPVAVSRVNVSKVFEQERGFDIWFFNVPLKGYDSFILQEVAGESEDWTYDTTEYAVSLVETADGYALMTEDGKYVNILNTYEAPEEPTPPPSEPEEEEPTIIRIIKTWEGGEYDGEVTFIVTDAETDREYVETLDEGDRFVDVEVRRGGTYYVEEIEIEGWETTFTDRKGNPDNRGDIVNVEDGETAKVYVTNTLIEEEEEIPDEEPPMVEEPSGEPPVEEIPDEEIPIVAPPKTGSAAGSAAALFACAALLGTVVLRKKK
ncbi:MAG: hypothetical protein IJD13_08760, partial [Oscillospiraceae bacterium]|nr:hypothetical protein [Oscillospiraceae bacterium]